MDPKSVFPREVTRNLAVCDAVALRLPQESSRATAISPQFLYRVRGANGMLSGSLT